ncbi:hypothetical protein F8M41_011873 [Gigaspora margarita]|uniref:Uncharacterized protein n=1 Tax=Gigaspora margarita TaxID=4874 RepID=A0A8H4ATD9_GIGMA|nr:hypothetical protein F8M41_011873 [Gigaspora margarita]
MGQVNKKDKKNQQNVNIDWIINSSDPKPIAFFRLTHPKARSRAIEKYKKCFNLALSRSKDANLDKLKAVNNSEKIIQRDWEIWLKEKKAIEACRMGHNTNLQIQQDFAITVKMIVSATKTDIGKHNNFASGSHHMKSEESTKEEENDEDDEDDEPLVPKRLKFDNSDINEVDYIETQSMHLRLTGYSPSNPFFIPVKDDVLGENDASDKNDASDSSYYTRSKELSDDAEHLYPDLYIWIYTMLCDIM